MKQKLTHQGFLERLLSLEVVDADEQLAGGLACCALPACRPVHPFGLRLLGSTLCRQEAESTIHLADVEIRRCHRRAVDRAARVGGKDHVGRRPRTCGCGGGGCQCMHNCSRSCGSSSPRGHRRSLDSDDALLRRSSSFDHRRSWLSSSACRSSRRLVPSCQPQIPERQHRSNDQSRDRELGQGLRSTTR